jgi:pimeloyl-ACP methyl ester carboxylesterase
MRFSSRSAAWIGSLLAPALVFAGYRPTPFPDSCPSLERLETADARADASAAAARGDYHLLMLGGFVGRVPGAGGRRDLPTVMIVGTDDTTTLGCMRLDAAAEDYARRYNETVVSLHR